MSKRASITVFEHQFWCHFHHILSRYHNLYISSNKLIILYHLWEMSFKLKVPNSFFTTLQINVALDCGLLADYRLVNNHIVTWRGVEESGSSSVLLSPEITESFDFTFVYKYNKRCNCFLKEPYHFFKPKYHGSDV